MVKYREIEFFTDESKTEKDILVWEDSDGFGICRVNFLSGFNYSLYGYIGPRIYFRYWGE